MKTVFFLLLLILVAVCLGKQLDLPGRVSAVSIPQDLPRQPEPTSLPPTQEPAPVEHVSYSPVLPPDEPVLVTPSVRLKQPQESPTPTATQVPTLVPTPTAALTPTPSGMSSDEWKKWAVMPQVSPEMIEIYRRGLEQGNNPNAFSILGDCQSQPDVFMGLYEFDTAVVDSLPDPLRETIGQFYGSFNRYSPTVKDGTTEGALLWAQWNDNKEGFCEANETPIDCELRVHKPSIVFIHIGTHWEARNRRYLTLLLDKIIAHGAVPVFATKADNRELDERVNRTMAELALEYNVPLWNFWASVQHLPNHGLKNGSDMYLNRDAVEIHRLGALQALDTVWRAANESEPGSE